MKKFFRNLMDCASELIGLLVNTDRMQFEMRLWRAISLMIPYIALEWAFNLKCPFWIIPLCSLWMDIGLKEFYYHVIYIFVRPILYIIALIIIVSNTPTSLIARMFYAVAAYQVPGMIKDFIEGFKKVPTNTEV